jgi:hypothetical protein
MFDAPTDSDVERWHSEYVAVLRELYGRHRRPGDELVVHDTFAARTDRIEAPVESTKGAELE